MRTASAGREPAGAGPWCAAAEELARAVRTVDRWALVAGVTGLLANVLLVALFMTPADGPYAWTGAANDVVGDVSTLATIPVAVGLLAVCGHRRGLGAITLLAIVAMAVMTTASMLMVLGLAPFAAGTDSAYTGMIFLFGWVFAAGRTGWASGRLPRQVAGWGVALGAAGLAGAALLTASAPMPAHSLTWDITFGAGWLTAIPVALFPVWLIVLSYRLPGHLLAAPTRREDAPNRSTRGGLNALPRHEHPDMIRSARAGRDQLARRGGPAYRHAAQVDGGMPS